MTSRHGPKNPNITGVNRNSTGTDQRIELDSEASSAVPGRNSNASEQSSESFKSSHSERSEESFQSAIQSPEALTRGRGGDTIADIGTIHVNNTTINGTALNTSRNKGDYKAPPGGPPKGRHDPLGKAGREALTVSDASGASRGGGRNTTATTTTAKKTRTNNSKNTKGGRNGNDRKPSPQQTNAPQRGGGGHPLNHHRHPERRDGCGRNRYERGDERDNGVSGQGGATGRGTNNDPTDPRKGRSQKDHQRRGGSSSDGRGDRGGRVMHRGDGRGGRGGERGTGGRGDGTSEGRKGGRGRGGPNLSGTSREGRDGGRGSSRAKEKETAQRPTARGGERGTGGRGDRTSEGCKRESGRDDNKTTTNNTIAASATTPSFTATNTTCITADTTKVTASAIAAPSSMTCDNDDDGDDQDNANHLFSGNNKDANTGGKLSSTATTATTTADHSISNSNDAEVSAAVDAPVSLIEGCKRSRLNNSPSKKGNLDSTGTSSISVTKSENIDATIDSNHSTNQIKVPSASNEVHHGKPTSVNQGEQPERNSKDLNSGVAAKECGERANVSKSAKECGERANVSKSNPVRNEGIGKQGSASTTNVATDNLAAAMKVTLGGNVSDNKGNPLLLGGRDKTYDCGTHIPDGESGNGTSNLRSFDTNTVDSTNETHKNTSTTSVAATSSGTKVDFVTTTVTATASSSTATMHTDTNTNTKIAATDTMGRSNINDKNDCTDIAKNTPSSDAEKFQESTIRNRDIRNISTKKNGTTTITSVPPSSPRSNVTTSLSNNKSTRILTGAETASKKKINHKIVPPGTATKQQQPQDNSRFTATKTTSTKKNDDKEIERSQAEDDDNESTQQKVTSPKRTVEPTTQHKNDEDDEIGCVNNDNESHDEDYEDEQHVTLSKGNIGMEADESKGLTTKFSLAKGQESLVPIESSTKPNKGLFPSVTGATGLNGPAAELSLAASASMGTKAPPPPKSSIPIESSGAQNQGLAVIVTEANESSGHAVKSAFVAASASSPASSTVFPQNELHAGRNTTTDPYASTTQGNHDQPQKRHQITDSNAENHSSSSPVKKKSCRNLDNGTQVPAATMSKHPVVHQNQDSNSNSGNSTPHSITNTVVQRLGDDDSRVTQRSKADRTADTRNPKNNTNGGTDILSPPSMKGQSTTTISGNVHATPFGDEDHNTENCASKKRSTDFVSSQSSSSVVRSVDSGRTPSQSPNPKKKKSSNVETKTVNEENRINDEFGPLRIDQRPTAQFLGGPKTLNPTTDRDQYMVDNDDDHTMHNKDKDITKNTSVTDQGRREGSAPMNSNDGNAIGTQKDSQGLPPESLVKHNGALANTTNTAGAATGRRASKVGGTTNSTKNTPARLLQQIGGIHGKCNRGGDHGHGISGGGSDNGFRNGGGYAHDEAGDYPMSDVGLDNDSNTVRPSDTNITDRIDASHDDDDTGDDCLGTGNDDESHNADEESEKYSTTSTIRTAKESTVEQNQSQVGSSLSKENSSDQGDDSDDNDMCLGNDSGSHDDEEKEEEKRDIPSNNSADIGNGNITEPGKDGGACTERSVMSLEELRRDVPELFTFLDREDVQILHKFRYFTRDNILHQDDDRAKLVLLLGDFDRACQSNQDHDDFDPICEQLHHLRVTDPNGIITTVFDALMNTKYTDWDGTEKTLSEFPLMKSCISNINIVDSYEGMWDTNRVIYVSNEFDASSETEIMDYKWGNTVYHKGPEKSPKKYIAVCLLLRKKNGEVYTITKTEQGDYQHYQVNGGKSSTVKQLQHWHRRSSIVLIYYRSDTKFTRNLANECGGYRAVPAILNAVEEHDSVDESGRTCLIDAFTKHLHRIDLKCNPTAVEAYYRNAGIEMEDSLYLPFGLLRSVITPEEPKSTAGNIHFTSLNNFLTQNKIIVGPGEILSDEDRKKRLILKDEDVGRFSLKSREKLLDPNNKLWNKRDGTFLVNIMYHKGNETSALAADRHVLLFDAKNRYVGDKGGGYTIVGDEGNDDNRMQQMLKDHWANQHQTYTVVNVWELRDQRIQSTEIGRTTARKFADNQKKKNNKKKKKKTKKKKQQHTTA